MSNNFHVNSKEEILNQMREELRERAKSEFFSMTIVSVADNQIDWRVEE